MNQTLDVGQGDTPNEDLIRAAGCLVYRYVNGEIEVLVAHRPRYDDWDFPKGKLEEGETFLEAAVRETSEETGFTGVIGPELASDRYQVRGRPKVVRWWLMNQTSGEFVVNEEVDEVRWLSRTEALKRLSYDHPRLLLEELQFPDET